VYAQVRFALEKSITKVKVREDNLRVSARLAYRTGGRGCAVAALQSRR